MKLCSNKYCVEVFPEFSPDKRASDGLASKCKTCHRDYYRQNKDRYNCGKWSKENPDLARAAKLLWKSNNRHKTRQMNAESKRRHPETSTKYRRRRRSAIKKATPRWLNENQRAAIKEFYSNRPIGMTVDHIVPLLGKNISGLHVPWNLQYLTPQDNAKKGTSLVGV